MSAEIAAQLEILLTPLDPGMPAGIDLRSETGHDALYFRLKDARTAARAGERAAEASGDSPSAIVSEWRTVLELAQTALSRRSKDLEIAAWMIEALVRLHGFAGLELGFRLAQGLIERFWSDLHSVEREEVAGKVSPLSGLNGIGGEGTLIQPIRMVSLLPGRPFGTFSLWHHQLARRDPGSEVAMAFARELAAAAPGTLRTSARAAQAALDCFASLTTTLETVCGPAAPPSSKTRNVLIEVTDAYRAMIGEEPGEPAPSVIDHSAITAPAADVAPHMSEAGGIRTREQAFAELLRIASFFRKAEPHSPISYAIETLVTRGKMDLIDLLHELLPDAASRSQFLQIAGIGAKAANGDARQ
jgi:type VI secretion system protein ImpA